MFYNLPYIVVGIIILLGLYAVIFKRNIIKIIIGLSIIESGVNLFLIALGYRENAIAPIFTNAMYDRMVLPTPQALTLTSIVIGVAVTALMLTVAMVIYKKYKTLNANEINRLKG